MGILTQYELAWEPYRAGLNGDEIGERVNRDRATAYRWLARIRKLGIREFVRRKKERRRRRQTYGVCHAIKETDRAEVRKCKQYPKAAPQKCRAAFPYPPPY